MNDIRDTASFVEREPTSALVLSPLRDDFASLDHLKTTAIASSLRESAVMASDADGVVNNNIRERASISSAAHPSTRIVRTTRDSAFIVGRAVASARLTEDVSESAVIIGSHDLSNASHDVKESAQIESRAVTSRVTRADVTDRFTATSRIAAGVFESIRSTAVISSRASARSICRVDERSSGVLRSSVEHADFSRLALRSTATIRARHSVVVRHRPTARSRGFISGSHLADDLGIAWTANTLTWAMSRYENFPYSSITERFALGDGVFAANDAVAPARFVTGDLDFGTSKKKHVFELYATEQNEEPLEIEITAHVNARRVTARYEQSSRDATDHKVIRCKAGKGFSSTYYQIAFESSSNFELIGCEATFQTNSRRT